MRGTKHDSAYQPAMEEAMFRYSSSRRLDFLELIQERWMLIRLSKTHRSCFSFVVVAVARSSKQLCWHKDFLSVEHHAFHLDVLRQDRIRSNSLTACFMLQDRSSTAV